MNVGQVLEVHLGWAAKGVGHRIADMLRDERTAQVKNVRAYLDKVYNTTGSGARIDELTDDEVMEMAQNLKNGVPFATPCSTARPKRKSRRCSSWPIRTTSPSACS